MHIRHVPELLRGKKRIAGAEQEELAEAGLD
jgi:hypothetical protein